MNRHIALSLMLAVSSIGCGGLTPPPRKEPIKVNGRAILPGGKPVRDVMITLQPMEDTNPAGAKVEANGAFTLNASPGKYMYYFTAQDGKPAGLKAIPEQYRSPKMERFVQIQAGQDVSIELQ